MPRTTLYIFDANDNAVGDGPRSGDELYRLGVQGGAKGLWAALDRLVKEGRTFNKVIWQTHGDGGRIGFTRDLVPTGNATLDAFRKQYPGMLGNPDVQMDLIQYIDFMNPKMLQAGYEKLFPMPTKMYFDGCNVADTDEGWKFLEKAGGLFLHGGGQVIGWTSKGINLWAGHTVHFWGDVRTVVVGGKGKITGRHTTEMSPRERRGMMGNVGNKV